MSAKHSHDAPVLALAWGLPIASPVLLAASMSIRGKANRADKRDGGKNAVVADGTTNEYKNSKTSSITFLF
jgi:hypothetical protein